MIGVGGSIRSSGAETIFTDQPILPIPLAVTASAARPYGRTMTTDILHTFRASLAAVDPATLTGADRRALIDLVQASMVAAGIE